MHPSSSLISFINNIRYLGIRLVRELSDDCDVNQQARRPNPHVPKVENFKIFCCIL